MAIENGQAIGCADLQASGGVRHILIREWKAGDLITVNDAASTVTRIQDSGALDADWGVFESKIETSGLTINGTNEGKDVNTYELNLSFNLPRLNNEKIVRLQEFQDAECLMVIVIDSNSDGNYVQNFVMGISDKFKNVYDYKRNQTYARIASIEGGTGAAFSDETGLTVTITCTQYQLPLTYVEAAGNGITIAATGLTATTT